MVRLLACKSNYWNALASLFARWHLKIKSLHAFGMLPHVDADYAGMHSKCGTSLANSHKLRESINVIMKNTINVYDITSLRYLVIKEKFE